MAKRVSDAEWRGDLKDGAGTLRLGSGAFEGKIFVQVAFRGRPRHKPRGAYRRRSRGVFLDGSVGGAVAEGPRTDTHPYESYRPFRPGDGRFCDLPHELETEGQVPGIDAATFEQVAQAAKRSAPSRRPWRPWKSVWWRSSR